MEDDERCGEGKKERQEQSLKKSFSSGRTQGTFAIRPGNERRLIFLAADWLSSRQNLEGATRRATLGLPSLLMQQIMFGPFLVARAGFHGLDGVMLCNTPYPLLRTLCSNNIHGLINVGQCCNMPLD